MAKCRANAAQGLRQFDELLRELGQSLNEMGFASLFVHKNCDWDVKKFGIKATQLLGI